MDYGRVFILDIAEIRRRFRALETITATRCAHETTALFYRTSACFTILLNNSTSTLTAEIRSSFPWCQIHASQNSSGLAISFEVQQCLNNNSIVQYLYLLTSRLKRVCPDIRVKFIYFSVTRVNCFCIDRCVSVASVIWLRYFYGRHHVALTRRADSLATFFFCMSVISPFHVILRNAGLLLPCPVCCTVVLKLNLQATFMIGLTDLITSSFDTKLSECKDVRVNSGHNYLAGYFLPPEYFSSLASLFLLYEMSETM